MLFVEGRRLPGGAGILLALAQEGPAVWWAFDIAQKRRRDGGATKEKALDS